MDVHEERTARLKLAEEQRSYVDARDRELRKVCQGRWNVSAASDKRLADAIYGLQGRWFCGRMNWLFTGR